MERPSQKKKAPAAALADLQDDGKRVTFRAARNTRLALDARAAEAGYAGPSAVKHYLLKLAAVDGAKIDSADLRSGS